MEELVFELEPLKAVKLGVFLTVYTVAMVTHCEKN